MKPAIFIIFALFSLVSVSQENVTCVICIDTEEGNIVQKPCGHSFHEHCIEEWLKERPSCPICLRVLKEPAAEQSPEEGVQPYIVQIPDIMTLIAQQQHALELQDMQQQLQDMQQGQERIRQQERRRQQILRRMLQQHTPQQVAQQIIRDLLLLDIQQELQDIQQELQDTRQQERRRHLDILPL